MSKAQGVEDLPRQNVVGEALFAGVVYGVVDGGAQETYLSTKSLKWPACREASCRLSVRERILRASGLRSSASLSPEMAERLRIDRLCDRLNTLR